VQRRTTPAARRTGAANAARIDPATAAALKVQAVDEAAAEMLNGAPLTGKEWGARYGKGEEWGRQRLIDARAQVNGRMPGPAPAE
jgi:hypothetical protein